ncbi:hypothetical protein QD47_14585 [Paenibacillus terrae]|uniref:ABC transmembrane type-1 domain-containing protein n=1 Tax=Paenibacillus terrae TaxID=159743 RepID=A0A0D7X1X4_9BACL|nr:hypothetical protein QD47_14585 [Paenibacillus terrae]
MKVGQNKFLRGVATVFVDIFRGGNQSVDRGQMEAARSLGLPYRKAMMKIVIPQAIRIMIPSFIN